MKTMQHGLFEQDNPQILVDEKQGQEKAKGIVLDKDVRLKLTKYISTFSNTKELIEVKGKLIDFIRRM